MDVPAMGTLLGIRRQQVASRLDVPDGRQVARAPVRLQDRHNGEMAPPLSTGVVWTGASAPINSDAVRCTGRLALARLAGGRSQEVCATTAVPEPERMGGGAAAIRNIMRIRAKGAVQDAIRGRHATLLVARVE
ncbi:uncharacterized protein [Triticum aestivum]|uniref:uncharacterized protein isoform X1 n=1 Tax=Triticum aestivum TaxID=4565 RepID=UPI001D033420|nr:uncharacterized protein LOC123160847 isoform X1 [Triticum aestivum]